MVIGTKKRAICIGMMLVLTAFVGIAANVRAENLPPVANAGGAYISDEAGAIIFDGSGSHDPDGDPLQYNWSINGTWTGWSSNPTAEYTWFGVYSGEITLNVTDGSLYDLSTTTVTVYNSIPTDVNVTGPTQIFVGTELKLNVTFFDGNGRSDGSSDTYTAIFDWGDGLFSEIPLGVREFSFSGTHIYTGITEPTTYLISITIIDNYGGQVSASYSIIVLVEPEVFTVDAGPDGNIDEGSLFVSTGSFVSSAGGPFTGTVDYGDGSGPQPLFLNPDGTFALEHQYLENDLYTATVTIFKDGSALGSDGAQVNVMNVAPTAMLVNDGPKDEGSPVTISFTDQYDPGILDTFTYSFDWNNDGIYELVDQSSPSATYTWYDYGSYVVKGMIMDDDYDYNEYSTLVVVNNIAPTAMLVNDGPKGEGMPVAVSFTNQYDPGTSDTFTYSFDWNNDGIYEIIDQTGASMTHTWYDDGVYTVKGMIKDSDGGFNEYTTLVTVNNVAPSALLVNDGPKDEGSPVMVSFTNQYDPGVLDTFTYSFDWNNDGIYEISNQASASIIHTWYDEGVYTVKGKIQDDDGGFTEYNTVVTVVNVPPMITSLSGPVDPVLLGNSITFNGVFTDPGILDSHVALISWGDNLSTTINLAAGVYQVSKNHIYGNIGVYTITLTVTDDDGGSDMKSIESYVVIFNPNGGFVTGGGWLISPQGSYPANPTLSGRVNFGFVSKYKKGQMVPEGETEFQFQLANINFHSHVQEWLIIVGAKATYLGEGTINGQGHYGFRLTVIDGKISGGGGVDKLRMKIWDKDNNDQIVYDTDYGAPDSQNPSVALSGGQITIHKA